MTICVLRPKYWCFQIICWCCIVKRSPGVIIKLAWRAATPMFRRSRSQQRPAFILGRNRWLNMTGRKWESGAVDASRYCQITGRMRQISLFLHLVLVISLATSSSLIFHWYKGMWWGVSSTLHLQWGGTVSNGNVILKSRCSHADSNLGKNASENGTKQRRKKSQSSSCCRVLLPCAMLTCLQLLYRSYAFALPQHRWIYLRKRHLITPRKTMERQHEKKNSPSARIN